MTLKELVSRLRPGELYATVAGLVGVATVAFAGGYAWRSTMMPASPEHICSNPVECAAYAGPAQRALGEREAMKQFSRFFDLTAGGVFEEAYSLLSEGWKDRIGRSVARLASEYRMTKSQQVNYVIPLQLNDDVERYRMEIEYSDYFPRLPTLVSLASAKLTDALAPGWLDRLADEMVAELPECYAVPADDHADLRRSMIDYLGARANIRDVVLNDELLDDYGRSRGYLPKAAAEKGPGTDPAGRRHRLVDATLVKEKGAWKVHAYNSLMIEKR